MSHASEPIIKALKAKRLDQGLTQRALAHKVSSPQSHIARIESGLVDPKLSTVIELARTLELEIMVIPRQILPVVQALVRGRPTDPDSAPRSLYALTEDEDEDD